MDSEDKQEKVTSGLLGFAVADALGVPIEFTSRWSHQEEPLTEMVGYGSHDVPAGTWSDDTSMTIATMDSIGETRTIDYDDIMKKYCLWAFKAQYTATGKVFDIGNGTGKALSSYRDHITTAVESGGKDVYSNGNGSLMRMLPIAFYAFYRNLSDEEITEVVDSYSGMTHGHPISKLGCHIYCDFIRYLLEGKNKEEAFDLLKNHNYVDLYGDDTTSKYSRILDGSIKGVDISKISSSGYIVDTLEACFWSFLSSNNYENAVVTAVNLGDDTDTVGAITGSMAGVVYGKESIPKRWLDALQRKDYLEDIALRFSKALSARKWLWF